MARRCIGAAVRARRQSPPAPIHRASAALAFAAAAVTVRQRRRRLSWHSITLVLAAVLWAVFTPYELHMLRWEQNVQAPIRADLVLLAPFYWIVTLIGWIVTLIGLVAAVTGLRARRPQPAQEAT